MKKRSVSVKCVGEILSGVELRHDLTSLSDSRVVTSVRERDAGVRLKRRIKKQERRVRTPNVGRLFIAVLTERRGRVSTLVIRVLRSVDTLIAEVRTQITLGRVKRLGLFRLYLP